MKKHIKKIICLVAVLVLCVSAFVVPSLAFFVDATNGDYLGTNIVVPKVIYNDYFYGEQYVDVYPTTFYDDMNDVSYSDVWYVDEYYSEGAVYYGGYNFLTSGNSPDNTANLLFETYRCRTNDTDYLYQFRFVGKFKAVVNIEYYGDGGQYDNWRYYFDYLNYEDVQELNIADLMPVDLSNGTVYVTISDFYIVDPDTFYIYIPYYHDEYYVELAMLPISTNDFKHPVYFDEVPMGQFLWDSITNFLSFEIMPGVSLYIVLTAVIALPLFIWFLKLFSGG